MFFVDCVLRSAIRYSNLAEHVAFVWPIARSKIWARTNPLDGGMLQRTRRSGAVFDADAWILQRDGDPGSDVPNICSKLPKHLLHMSQKSKV